MKKPFLYILLLFVTIAFMISCEKGEKVNGVRATQDTNGSIGVSWQALTNPEYSGGHIFIGYNVYWSKDPSFPETSTNKGSVPPSVNTFSTGKLEPGEWHVQVRALYKNTYNKIGSSDTVEEEGPSSEISTVVIK